MPFSMGSTGKKRVTAASPPAVGAAGNPGANRPKSDRDNPHARIPVRRTKGSKLLHVPIPFREPGLLCKFPGSSFPQILFREHETAGQSPGTEMGFASPLDQQHVERVVADHEQRHVSGYREWRKGRSVILVRSHGKNINCLIDNIKGEQHILSVLQ